MGRKARLKTKSIFGKILCSIVYLVLFMPIAVVVVNSFNATTSKPYLTWKGFTIDWYFKLFENESLLASFGKKEELIRHIYELAVHTRGQRLTVEDQMIALSTCSSGNTNGRHLLICKVIKENTVEGSETE